MADLRKKMSLEHPTQILTTHDLGNLRILQQQQQHHHHQQHNPTTAVGSNVTATTTTKTLFGGNIKNLNGNSNMIFSTIPLDARSLIIPTIGNGTQSQTSTNNQQHHPQQQRFTVTSTSTNGFRSGNIVSTVATSPATTSVATNNNISNLLAAAGVTTKATILNTSNTNNSSNINNSNNNVSISVSNNNNSSSNTNGNTMPTTSKYLFVQQNSNGQYTTYEGSTTTATATGNGSTNVGNIVLLATEPLNGSSSEQQHVITTTPASTGADNDEELRPLAWLNDSNLIKGIVTTTGATTASNSNNNGLNTKRSNICIVNAANAHDLIEELPPHVASEENVIATTHSVEGGSGAQITTLSVSDFQQQFIASNKRYAPIGSSSQLGTLANFALAHEAATTNSSRDVPPHHIYGNIAALGATTSVHVGPSGTTTVVEYKTTNGNFLPPQRQLLNGGNIATISAASSNNNSTTPVTTITATNLSNNNNTNTNVPSSSSASASSSSSSTLTTGVASAMQKTLMTLPTATTLITTTTNAANANGNPHQQQGVVNGTTNTIYQGQKPLNTNNNNSTTSSAIPAATTATTTHHPHKKYLREKMNVLDHGGGVGSLVGSSNSNINTNSGVALALVVSSAPTVNSPQSATPASTITVVASPASSLSSSSSSSSTSSSTAAVNGGNSPVSKSFFTLGNGNGGATAIAVNYASNSSNSPSPPSTASAFSPTTLYVTTTPSSLSTPLSTTGLPTSYTIVNQTSQQNVGSSPAIVSSPEPQSTKDYYTLSSVSQNNSSHHHQKRMHHQSLQQNQQSQQHQSQQQHLHHQQQQQQQQHHSHSSMRSPISHSSYENDSLKDFEISPTESSIASTGARLSAASTPQHHSSTQAYHTQSSASGKSSSHGGTSGNTTPQKQKHPNNVPYDPLVHTHNKPPYSFSSLIFMAIEGSQEKALPVKEIYAWIVQHFPYFKTAPTGWKNSVRHNLSLNKSFVKVEKAPNMGKGSLWRVEQQQRQNLIQALARSPFFPNSVGDKLALKGSANSNGSNNIQSAPNGGYDTIDGAVSPPPQASPAMSTVNSKSPINARFDPQLFPKLSKTFKDMSEPSGALSDVPDDEYPSDYSTTNHHNNNKNNNNNIIINNNSITSNNNNSKYNNNYVLQNNEIGISSGVGELNGNCNGGGVVMGTFSSYESIERLARDCGADNIDDVNAATAMLALKHGPKVFAETFQNGSPVITSSPSEDHTYSAGGGSAAGSGASTPLINGSSSGGMPIMHNSNGSKQNGCDNQSNCASSDAAYESSEESHNITPEELEDQKRHRDGVDALLSLSVSSVVDSVSCSPVKRPASTSVEEEQLAACFESNSNMSNASSPAQHVGKMSLLNNNTATYSPRHHHTHQLQQLQSHIYSTNIRNNSISIFDEGYNTQGYYGTNSTATHHQFNSQQHQLHLNSASPQKKGKPLRNLRTKIKRKVPWMR